MQKPKREVLESKDMYKVWKKVKEMKNGYRLQAYLETVITRILPKMLVK